ncbi:MAG: hypothetical protein QNJ15_03365 [Erythrobacter sp.]|nr:hypothetical protein [Erythrobacter sp.]
MSEFAELLLPYLTSSFAFVVILMTMFWNADKFVSKEGRERLTGVVSDYEKGGFEKVLPDVRAAFERYFPANRSLGSYLPNVLLLSFLSMLAVGVVYFTNVGGFWMQFQAGGEISRNFASQLFFDGLLKVFIVNAIAMLPYRSYMARLQDFGLFACIGLLFLDIAFRLFLFFAISAVVWSAFALIFGSFGGDIGVALGAIPETFLNAARFQNLTGVYVYAAAIGSLPLFLTVTVRMICAYPAAGKFVRTAMFWLPWREKPFRFLIVLTCILLGMFGLLTALLVGALSPAS